MATAAADISVEESRWKPARVSARNGSQTEQPEVVDALVNELSISPVTARILISRGIDTIEDAKAFLSPTLRSQLPDPKQIKNIEAAAEFMLDAIERGEQMTVYSDFDVDGLSSGSQLVLYLDALGASVNHYTPNRFSEGYGLVKSAIDKLAKAGTQLLITVDCGISNHDEIAFANRLGLKTIVLDHHEPHGLPPAEVVVDPAQDGCPFQEYRMAAAGLVWMLLIVLRQAAKSRWPEKIESGEVTPPDPKEFLDLAALGTICDMVPLQKVNRVIAHRGIEALKNTTRVGLVALKEVAGVNNTLRFGSGHVGFAIGPRINAAGRLDDASQVFELLITKDPRRAQKIANSIDRLNKRRREIEDRVRDHCIQRLRDKPQLLNDPAFALFGEDFHAGVIGIVAQRLVERFHRPAAVMAPGEITINGEVTRVIKGSVRSIRGFNVAEVLQALDDVLIGHGGHAAAGGFSVSYEKLEEFKKGFVREASSRLSAEMLERTCFVDIEISLNEIDFQLADEIGRLAPFGVGNPSPVLVSNEVTIDSVQMLSNGHLRLRFTDGESSANAVAWSFQGHPLLRKGKRVNIAYQPEINTYRGISSVQLNLKEVWE